MKEILQHIVADFLIEAGLGEAEFTRCYHLGIRALKELSYDITGKVRSEKLFINPDGTADLPEDCLKVTRLGQIRGGEFIAWTLNKNIAKRPTQGFNHHNHSEHECTNHNCQNDSMCPCRISNVYGEPWGNGLGTSPFYGGGSLGVGSYINMGEYKIDGDLIYLSPDCNSGAELYVEYVSFKDETEEGNILVHPYLREAIIAFLHWKFELVRRSQFRGDRPYYESLWHREKRKAKMRLKSHNLQELNQNARQHTKGGLKS